MRTMISKLLLLKLQNLPFRPTRSSYLRPRKAIRVAAMALFAPLIVFTLFQTAAGAENLSARRATILDGSPFEGSVFVVDFDAPEVFPSGSVLDPALNGLPIIFKILLQPVFGDDCEALEIFDEIVSYANAVCEQGNFLFALLGQCSLRAAQLSAQIHLNGICNSENPMAASSILSLRQVRPVRRPGQTCSRAVSLLRLKLNELQYFLSECFGVAGRLETVLAEEIPVFCADVKFVEKVAKEAFTRGSLIMHYLDRIKSEGCLANGPRCSEGSAPEEPPELKPNGSVVELPAEAALGETIAKILAQANTTSDQELAARLFDLAERLSLAANGGARLIALRTEAKVTEDFFAVRPPITQDNGNLPLVVIIRAASKDSGLPKPNELDDVEIFNALKLFWETLHGGVVVLPPGNNSEN